MNNKIRVSVIIPTYNRAKDLERCLDSLLQQTFKDFENIVINNGCTDETLNVIQKYPVKVINDLTGNVTHLFNIGWQNAEGEIIVFTNDDAEVEPLWLENIMNTFQRFENTGAVGGPTIVPEQVLHHQEMLRLHTESRHSMLLRIPAWIYENLVLDRKYYEIGVLCDSGAYSVGGSLTESTRLVRPISVDLLSITNVAIKKSVLETVGGLDENFRFTHGDGDLFIRIKKAGYKLVFNPKVIVWHHVNTIGDTRNAYWRGRDHAYFLKKCIRPKTIPGRLKLILNGIFLNLYWIYKSVKTKDIGFLKGISGFVQGLIDYHRVNKK